MIDHAVLIPSSEGPVGGIVSEPDGELRAGMILLGGHGRPARSGTNAFWTRTARGLTEHGVAVLRIDYSQEGETYPMGKEGAGLSWKGRFDLDLLRQVTPWFSMKLGAPPLFLGGVCGGARLSIELAADDPEAIAGTFLIVPEMSALGRPEGTGGELPEDLEATDPWAIECLRTILGRASSWAIAGEHDSGEISTLPRLIGPTPYRLDVEIVPGIALHFLDQPDIQEQTSRWLTARLADALAERGAA